jgi:hypothetical protein
MDFNTFKGIEISQWNSFVELIYANKKYISGLLSSTSSSRIRTNSLLGIKLANLYSVFHI